jgi:hypothetical protein
MPTPQNCFPFGSNTEADFRFMGFIYRNVPPFQLRVGDKFAFDTAALNNQDTRRNIYFAAASANPAPGGNPQDIRALGWTQITSDTQVPENPRGDTVFGNYELTYTAQAAFDFTGGGLIIAFGASPPGAYADTGCDQVLVWTTSGDSSGSFHRRFYNLADLTLGPLDSVATSGTSDTSWLGGFIIRPPRPD